MPLIADPFSSPVRPVLRGRFGAVAAAHPLAVAAGQQILAAGGSAGDAAIAAQAVLAVVTPDACGIGGDMLALVRAPGQPITAINGTGAAPRGLTQAADDGPHSVTVPGMVDAWCALATRYGRIPLAQVLAPAVRLARSGVRVSRALSGTLAAHRARLVSGAAQSWAWFDAPSAAQVVQPQLASILQDIGREGRDAFYAGAGAAAIAQAVQKLGGTLCEADLAAHATVFAPPIVTRWGEFELATQPPMAQGVLLNMAVQGFERLGPIPQGLQDHAAIELTTAAFAYRDQIAQGAALLALDLPIDLGCAANRAGPRAYLHTAGVAAVDAQGMVVSSLVSVFDDFGSCVFVPALGCTLNNRGGGFTAGENQAAPGKRPVHTLAPALLQTPQGLLALATPGADGQVQTLLQVLIGIGPDALDLAQAIARPRWRSENGELLIEHSHPAIETLRGLGHRVVLRRDGDLRFGAVVSAGWIEDEPIAAADWRRETATGVV